MMFSLFILALFQELQESAKFSSLTVTSPTSEVRSEVQRPGQFRPSSQTDSLMQLLRWINFHNECSISWPR